MEKKNKRLFVSLLALIAITVVVFLMLGEERANTVDKTLFRVDDFQSINKIVMETDTGKVELTFSGTRWRVNDRYDVDRNMITVLQATLLQAEPKRPVATSLQDSIGERLEREGVRVSLYRGGELARTFYAGGNATRTQSYFKDPQSGTSYVMAIPGYRVYISGILELNESGWRDKYVFGFNGRNFQGLETVFPGDPSKNFKVAMIGDQFGVEGLAKTDTAKLYTYLDAVLSLAVDEYLEPSGLTDSLLSSKPGMTITVTDIANRNYTLKFFQEKKGMIPAIFGENQGILFDRQKIRPLLRPKSFFELK